MPKTKFTAKEKKDYINNDGSRCPYCNSNLIMDNGYDVISHNNAVRYVECLSCKKAWIEKTQIIDILTDEEYHA